MFGRRIKFSFANRPTASEISKWSAICKIQYSTLKIHRSIRILDRTVIWKRKKNRKNRIRLFLGNICFQTDRVEFSSLTDKHLFVWAWARTIRSSIFTWEPSISIRKWILGCIMIQTLFRPGLLVNTTSQLRPDRVELLMHVRKS